MYRKSKDSNFKAEEALRKRNERQKRKKEEANKTLKLKHRITKLMLERKQLHDVNTNLKNQMFSDMAVNMKAKGIVRIGKEMYDKDFANRM